MIFFSTQDFSVGKAEEKKNIRDEVLGKIKSGEISFSDAKAIYNEKGEREATEYGYLFSSLNEDRYLFESITHLDVGGIGVASVNHGYCILQKLDVSETEETYDYLMGLAASEIKPKIEKKMFRDYVNELIKRYDIRIVGEAQDSSATEEDSNDIENNDLNDSIVGED